VARAQGHAPEIEPRLWSVLGRALRLELNDELAQELALRIQQVTGAITAKAVEDTLFYRHTRLVALNEVGGAPERFALPLDEFHRALVACQRPHALLASATHDTKRGEDLRARLLVLSECADDWRRAVERWTARAGRYRDPRISPSTEYFFYQTLVGAYPLDAERAWQYLQKAAREAKRETSWIRPDADYEAALERFVRGVLADRELLDDVAQFVSSIAQAGYLNALSRTLLKLCVPGVPDLYQGCELWDFSLVDPDNRRPVDFAQRRALLARLPELDPGQVLRDMESGTPKLWLIWKTLQLRKRRPELFDADYQALAAHGPDADSVIAFARGGALVCVVPRFNTRSAPSQRSAQLRLPPARYRDVLSDQRVVASDDGVPVSVLWSRFPAALLEREA
jgi:(1->4)-alpha-D-glucan 1-alpha-D-glucosylmutase